MRQKKKYMVITFCTTTEAMAFEKDCLEYKIPGRIIPVPREIAAGCGLAWRILIQDYLENQGKIQDSNLIYEKKTELII